MKAISRLFYSFGSFVAIILLCSAPTISAQVGDGVNEDIGLPDDEFAHDIYWQVKAYHPDAKLLRVKAIDSDGKVHDILAIQDSYDTSILNVKAFVDGKRLPVKLIVRDGEPFYSVKAINTDGTLIDVKVITDSGKILDLKGITRTGNVIQLRAISEESVFYTIIAISPNGKVNAVKGIKVMGSAVEAIISGVSVFAHVKAMSQN